jgi:hypothetical protein
LVFWYHICGTKFSSIHKPDLPPPSIAFSSGLHGDVLEEADVALHQEAPCWQEKPDSEIFVHNFDRMKIHHQNRHFNTHDPATKSSKRGLKYENVEAGIATMYVFF